MNAEDALSPTIAPGLSSQGGLSIPSCSSIEGSNPSALINQTALLLDCKHGTSFSRSASAGILLKINI